MQRILVIEDENDIRQLLRFNLEREGFAVLEAADGLGGLHMATSELYRKEMRITSKIRIPTDYTHRGRRETGLCCCRKNSTLSIG